MRSGPRRASARPRRLGYRSGYYTRTLVTRVGKLELRVPQDRDGRFSTELFERYQRSEQALVATLAEMYVQGVSTRKVKAITEELCGPAEDEVRRGVDGVGGLCLDSGAGLCLLGFDAGEGLRAAVALIVKDGGSDGSGGGVVSGGIGPALPTWIIAAAALVIGLNSATDRSCTRIVGGPS